MKARQEVAPAEGTLFAGARAGVAWRRSWVAGGGHDQSGGQVCSSAVESVKTRLAPKAFAAGAEAALRVWERIVD